MKPVSLSLLVSTVLAIASVGAATVAQADTVQARCDVFPKGSDRATSSSPCTFSQRQGNVGIQLQNGKRYDLTPYGDQPGNYRDQNGRAAYRQAGLGDQGQIYRLATESIFVYWDTTSFEGSPTNGNTSASNSQPAAGTTVGRLRDLIGARAGQAENTVKQRGYRYVGGSKSGDASYTYWLESRTNYCVTIRTEQGRYQSIVYAGGSADCDAASASDSSSSSSSDSSSRSKLPSIIVYADRDFGGPRSLFKDSIDNLFTRGLGNKVSSVQILLGRWKFCTEIEYRGACIILGPGNYKDLNVFKMEDKINSIESL